MISSLRRRQKKASKHQKVGDDGGAVFKEKSSAEAPGAPPTLTEDHAAATESSPASSSPASAPSTCSQYFFTAKYTEEQKKIIAENLLYDDEHVARRAASAAASSDDESSEVGDKEFRYVSPEVGTSMKIVYPEGMTLRSTPMFSASMGPRKSWMVGEIPVPSIRRFGFFMLQQKKRRFCFEVISPSERTDPLQGTKGNFVVSFKEGIDDAVDPSFDDQEALGDGDEVYLRVYRKRKRKEGEKADQLEDIGDDEHSAASATASKTLMTVARTDSESFGGSIQPIEPFSPTDISDWLSHKKYNIKDVQLLKSRGSVLELKLGVGVNIHVRDLTFQSPHEAHSFRRVLDKMHKLHSDRAMRQLARYENEKKMKPSAASANIGATGLESQDDPNAGLQPSIHDDDETIRLLIEIVSATDLPETFPTDPYVRVRMGGKLIHQTSVHPKTRDPIFTIRTGSLFVLCATPEDFFRAGGLLFVVRDFNTLSADEFLGSAYVSHTELLNSRGARIGYDLIDGREHASGVESRGCLYLRIREATVVDIQFMRELERKSGKFGVFSKDSTTLPPEGPQVTFLRRQDKWGEERETMHRVRPYPDPSREEATTWMSDDQILEESMKPSTHWIEAGSGTLGKLFVEILGCSKLADVNGSLEFWDSMDPFACLVFEDAIVNSDVIGNCSSPRWMPWCQRAFVFNINHPSSSLFIGIFDHDQEFGPLQKVNLIARSVHDPVGRVEIHVSNFKADTVYTLAYPLYFGDELEEHKKKEKGRLWIRVRKTWRHPQKATLAAISPAPPTVITVACPVDYRVARYTTQGPRDDTGFNIMKFSKYIVELQSYEKALDYLKHFAFHVWLWRGHYGLKFGGKQVLLPLHSLVAFFWGIVVTHDFNTFPSFLLFSVGWAFLAMYGYINRNPSPWTKCPSYRSRFKTLTSLRSSESTAIAPYQNLQTALNYEARIQKQERWMEKERELLKKHKGQIQADLAALEGQDEQYSVLDITTGSKRESLLMTFLYPVKKVLYPIQKQLRSVVIGLRISSSVILWEESYWAFWITTMSFVGSFLIFRIPFAFLVRWILRVLAWVFLGPWMKLVDRWYFAGDDTNDASDDDRIAKIREGMRKQYENFLKKASNYQQKRERALKQKSIKNFMFGTYHVRVPRFAETWFRHRPLPESYAEPYIEEMAVPIEIAQRMYGQRLEGDMIPRGEVLVHSLNRDDHRTSLHARFLERFTSLGQDLVPHNLQEVPYVGYALERLPRMSFFKPEEGPPDPVAAAVSTGFSTRESERGSAPGTILGALPQKLKRVGTSSHHSPREDV